MRQKYAVLIICMIQWTGFPVADAFCLENPTASNAVVLQLKYYHQFQFAGYYAAVEKDYYAKEGLDVVLKEGGLKTNTLEEVLGMRAEYGVTNSEILLHRLNGKPVVVLAAIFQHSPLVLVTRKIDEITNPQDLVGKIVKMTRKSRDVELHAVFLNEGVSLDQIRIADFKNNAGDYLNENIDALSAYVTNEPYYLSQRNIPYSVIHPITYGIDFYGDCLFTSEEEIKKHPDRVKAFRRASIAGWKYAMKNPDEIIDLIIEKYKSKKSREHLQYEAREMRRLILPELVETGHMNPGRWDHIAKTFVRFDMASPDYSLDGFVYNPNPHYNPARVRLIVGTAFAASFILGILLSVFVMFNKRLKREIEERKKSGKALSESEERYRQIVEISPDMIIIHRAETVIYINDSGVRILRADGPEQIVGKNVLTFVSPSSRKLAEERMRRHVSEIGKPTPLYEHKLICMDGTEIDVELVGIPFWYDDETAFQVIVRDVTERKKAEETLRKEKEKFKILVEQSPLGISLIGKNGCYEYVNPKFVEIFGYTMEDVPTGGDWLNRTCPDEKYRKKVVETWTGDLDEDGVGEAHPRTFMVTCKDGSEKTVHLKPVTLETGEQFIIYEDVTERKRLEAQFLQAQKMESVGTLAGGIAHDFNNLLMGIKGRASLMLADMEPSHPCFRHIGEIDKYVESASELTKRLLGFARGGKYEVKPSDPNELIGRSAEMFGRTKKEIAIHTDFQRDVLSVEADCAQIEQVMLNLFVNSWQAMPDGGDLFIRTENTVLDELRTSPFGLEPGSYVKISVSDTGIGMDRETIERIFEPFFTTKTMSRGSGLGLASVYGIIKNHGGFIDVFSEKGEGTTFDIYLPVSENEISEERLPDEEIVKGEGTVLLVDDEDMVVDVGKEMIQSLGYKVLTAESGERAIEIFVKNGNTIDIVILDMIMNGMDGSVTFDRLKAIDPNAKVLLSSGYSIDGKAREIIDRGCNGFIQKPFNLNELSKKVAEILET